MERCWTASRGRTDPLTMMRLTTGRIVRYRPWLWRALLAFGILGAGGFTFRNLILGTPVEALEAARGDLIHQVETNGPSGSDYAIALAALDQARANLAAGQVKLEQTIIKAPVDGVLIAREVEAGNIVQPGKELMVLAPAGETQVDVMIDERQLSRLAVGQKAIGSADAFPGERFAAELVYINPGIDALRGTVEVKLRVPDPPAYLRQDMTVSVDIEIARKVDALIVPAETVRDANGQRPWVLAINVKRQVQDNRAQARCTHGSMLRSARTSQRRLR